MSNPESAAKGIGKIANACNQAATVASETHPSGSIHIETHRSTWEEDTKINRIGRMRTAGKLPGKMRLKPGLSRYNLTDDLIVQLFALDAELAYQEGAFP